MRATASRTVVRDATVMGGLGASTEMLCRVMDFSMASPAGSTPMSGKPQASQMSTPSMLSVPQSGQIMLGSRDYVRVGSRRVAGIRPLAFPGLVGHPT
jgi:hypothetical protein